MQLQLAAAVGVAAAAFHTAAAGPHPQTFYSHPNTTISALAQDGSLIAWFSSGPKRCNTVRVVSAANGLKVSLPQQGPAQNVTCRWDVRSTPVELALARTSALWTLRETSPIPFDYLLGAGAGPGERRERRFQELAHTNHGAGLWLGGVAGDGPTLVYAVTSVDYVDEAGCLAGTGTCELQRAGGGVYRIAGREKPSIIPGTEASGAVAVSASGNAVAYVPAAGIGKLGRPVAGADLPVEIVETATGSSIASATPQGTPLALALTPHLLATLERTPLGLRIAWYTRATGAPLGSVPVAATASPELTATDRTIVYRVGRSIRAVDVRTHRLRSLARAAARPVGLSLAGRRLAWAENLDGSARIRTLAVRP